MTEETKRAFKLPLDLPKCECFQTHDTALVRCAMASQIAGTAGKALMTVALEQDFCRDSIPHILDMVVLSLMTHVVMYETAIECGTQEALWETERLITGMEERLIRTARHLYEESKALGLTAEKVQAMRERKEFNS